ncbi:MAG TPA: hypothetical protein VK211_03705 [Kamptonema sp.]|nr:hypothetical protein [Kamptonema sp.]
MPEIYRVNVPLQAIVDVTAVQNPVRCSDNLSKQITASSAVRSQN